MNFFTAEIKSWRDWEQVFQSIPDFTKLIMHILEKEALPHSHPENLTPGTNAVFKAGNYVIKIYAPKESGIDQTLDQHTELFATCFASEKNITTPRLIAKGFVEDKYRFAYIITEFINGSAFTDAIKSMSADEKTTISQKLRTITDMLNKPCEPFNGIDVINDTGRFKRWDCYPEIFRKERLNYIKSHNFGSKVFVHGDLCGDNILITPAGQLYIIDFADAVLAPAIYEYALIAVELFDLDPVLLHGYFGDYSAGDLADLCLNGLIIHDFGGDIVKHHIGDPCEFTCLEKLRLKIDSLIRNRFFCI